MTDPAIFLGAWFSISNVKVQMTNQGQKSNNKVYDLEERTARFGESVIDFVKTIPKNAVTNPQISQIVRSGACVGANYQEADDAESKKDFRHKISICRKEAKETKHWLRMLAKAEPSKTDQCRILRKEAQELTLIFSAMLKK